MVVSVDYQMFSVGNASKGALVDAFVDDTTIQIWSQNHLIETVARLRKGLVRKVRADVLHVKHQAEPSVKHQVDLDTAHPRPCPHALIMKSWFSSIHEAA